MESDINQRCAEISADIKHLRQRLNWSLNAACVKAFHQAHTDDDVLDDESEEKKFCGRYKKIFQRKSWEKQKATEITLRDLEILKAALLKTEEYRREVGSALPRQAIEKLQKISQKIKKALLSRDYEE